MAAVQPTPSPIAGHETSDVSATGVLFFGIGFVVSLGAIILLVWVLFTFLAGRAARQGVSEYPLAASPASQVPPEPRLQTNPRQDLLDLKYAEEATLESYGWVDRTAGVAHIPIEEAMRLTIERGLPARTADRRATP